MTDLTPETIKAGRLRLGLSQSQFAARINVPPNTVARWEQGLRTPTGLYAAAVRQLIADSKERQS